MYDEIFETVVQITHHDYAGCIDKKGWDHPAYFREQIATRQLNDQSFEALMQDYLRDYQELHMGFRRLEQESQRDVGFTVRRYEDSLYVTSSQQEKRIQVGDRIVALDGETIEQAAKRHARELKASHHEREDWSGVLLDTSEVEVIASSGGGRTLALQAFTKLPHTPSYKIESVEDTLILTMTDFWNHDAITELIRHNEGRFQNAKKLIIDVRTNKGGSDLAYSELLPYLFKGSHVDLRDFGDKAYTLCTERNVDLRVELMDQVLQTIEDEKTRHQIDVMVRELKKNRGNGFVELDLSEIEDNMSFDTKQGPEEVVVLSDVFCGSSGDSFVETVKHSDKVTVIGRPTLGMNDYANVAMMTMEEKFQFWYPTSKSSAVDEGNGMGGVGIQPDVYIPWTPEHLDKDVDLERSMEVLENFTHKGSNI
ncbi:S41 family peptidase [Halobacillus salinus]|uniref:Tail specific protease domain-containing protein n=1 Tax=Halobacillus salinus TaxID=192814 RepID=A0A4Z0GY12_9BACI|nr:S41 family peptidase [Halobacillus salinus]TGB02030.1 hypothetical protein E4663_15475 [Halobacillus salinus]